MAYLKEVRRKDFFDFFRHNKAKKSVKYKKCFWLKVKFFNSGLPPVDVKMVKKSSPMYEIEELKGLHERYF